ncbi:MAG: ABC transporter substrate-binding protein [Proteobacteria bacterium]|nr:ABC transporter substrate-binding protein [Pseudomonadota bacterium]
MEICSRPLPPRVHRSLLAFVLVAFALGLQGCARTEASGVHLSWIANRDDSGFEHELLRRFERAHPDITVSLVEMSHDTDNIHNQYATYLVSEDDAIDLYGIDVIWPAEFGSAGWALPLDDWLSAEARAEFLPGPLAACSYRGHLYALPWYSDAGMLYYRKDLLEESGVTPPTTWSELTSASRRLRARGRSGFVFQAGQYEGLVCNFLEHAWGNGGDVLDRDGRVVLDSPQNEEALRRMIELIGTDGVAPASVVTFREDESLRFFQSGSAVFLRSWPYVWGLTQKRGESLLGKVGIAPVPHADGAGHRSAGCLGGWNLMVSRWSKHPREAFLLASFLTSPEAQRERMLATGQLPTRIAPYSDAEVRKAHPEMADLLAVFEGARPRPVTPHYSKLSDCLQIELHRAISGEVDAGGALRAAAARLRALPGFEAAQTSRAPAAAAGRP